MIRSPFHPGEYSDSHPKHENIIHLKNLWYVWLFFYEISNPSPISSISLSPKYIFNENYPIWSENFRWKASQGPDGCCLVDQRTYSLGEKNGFSPVSAFINHPWGLYHAGKRLRHDLLLCQNPGMLSGVRGDLRYVPLKSKGGEEFRGGVFVGTENAHLGMFANDFFHALGGIHEKRRLVPCLYNFELQSDASQTPSLEHHAIYMGPWDIMSEHFVKKDQPPPGISSFTKIR